MNKKIIERMIVVFCLIGGILLGFLIYSFFQLFHSDLGYETYEIYEVEGDYHISECIWSNTVKSISGEISKSPEALEKALKEIAAEKVKERIKSIYNYYQWFYVELPYDIEKMLVEGEKYILFVCEQSEDVYWKNGENEFCGGVYQNQYQEEISNLPLESYMFSAANPLEQEELAEIGSMIWEIPELKKPELDRIEADQYTESVVEYIQGELFRMEKQGTYEIYFGRYEILNPYTRNISVAVVGEENYFMQYWVTEWDEDTYECWPVGDGYMEPCMDEICAERINRIVSLERLKVTVTPEYSIYAVNVNLQKYIPELGFSESLMMKGGNFCCWDNLLIMDNVIYTREKGTYRRTEENLSDLFKTEDLWHRIDIKQYENFIITINKQEDTFLVYDMDSDQLYNYPTYEYEGEFGPVWYVCDGTIYYMISVDEAETDRMIMGMDVFTGKNKKIYSLSEQELTNQSFLAYAFAIRQDKSILVAVNHMDDWITEFRKINYDDDYQITEKKLWETKEYEYMYTLQYNDYGFFMLGEFPYIINGQGQEVVCMKDNGEVESINILSICGLIITDTGYFLCDNSEEQNLIVGKLGRDDVSLITIVDSITWYDFEGKMIKRYYLDNEKFIKNGYELEKIVYDGNGMRIFYSNKLTGNLQIKYIPIMEENQQQELTSKTLENL